MENVPEGEKLRLEIRGKGWGVAEAAFKLGFKRRESLYPYFKHILFSDEFIQKIQTDLQIDLRSDKQADGKNNKHGSLKITTPETLNIKEESYIDSPFLTEVLDMGRLLQLPLDQLLLLQASAKEENDSEKYILISEVVKAKEDLEEAKEKIQSLKEFVEALKETIALLKKPPTK